MINGLLVRIPRPIKTPASLSSSPSPMHKLIKLPKLSKLSKTPKLDLNATQKVELPAITRFNTPNPKKIPQSFNNFPGVSITSADKQVINLERLINQEEKLSTILQKMNENSTVLGLLFEYWRIGADQSVVSIEKLFKDSRTKKIFQVSLVIEAVAIALMIFVYSFIGGNFGKLGQLKTMMAQVHQNLLTVIEMVLMKLPQGTPSSTWVNCLQETVQKKKFRTLKRAEYSTTLKHNCDIIANCIRNLTHSLPSNSAQLVNIVQILNNADKYSVNTARGYLSPNESQEKKEDLIISKIGSKEFTLVLDLDETLVHYSAQKGPGTLLVRPYCEEFLTEMGKLFEIVIFTAGVQEYADWAIDLIDIAKVTKYRLYRQHTSFKSGSYIKDLNKLGRDLSKIIIIDNVQGNFQMQPDNGIPIKTWIGDPNDVELKNMEKLLKEIILSGEPDIREAIKKVRSYLLL